MAMADDRRNDEIRGMVADPRTGFVGVPDGGIGAGAENHSRKSMEIRRIFSH